MGYKIGCLLALICSLSIIIAVLSGTVINFFLFYKTGTGVLRLMYFLFITYVVLFGLWIDTRLFSVEIDSVSSIVGQAFKMLMGTE